MKIGVNYPAQIGEVIKFISKEKERRALRSVWEEWKGETNRGHMRKRRDSYLETARERLKKVAWGTWRRLSVTQGHKEAVRRKIAEHLERKAAIETKFRGVHGWAMAILRISHRLRKSADCLTTGAR